MTTATCVRCERELADTAYACSGCTDRVRRALLGDDRGDDRPGLVDTAPAAQDIANGLSRSQNAAGGSGVPGSRVPLDLGATARLDAVRGTIGTWVRVIVDQRGIYPPSLPHGFDILAPSARFLSTQLEYARHQQWADEMFDEIEACARVVRGIARGPGEKLYLGTCGAEVTWDDDGNEIPRESPCAGDVYAHPGAESGTCRACKARWDVSKRRAWLDGEVRQRAYRASEIEDAYGIKANLIRQWATPERGLLRVHDRDFLGRARYMLGEVLDLAVQQKAKAAERAAERERRAAGQAAEMGA